MEPERCARLRTVSFRGGFRKKEMKGPQGLGDAGAEAKTERARFVDLACPSCFSALSPIALLTVGRLVLLPGCQTTYSNGFRMCSVLLEKHGCRDQAAAVNRRRVHLGSYARRSFRG